MRALRGIGAAALVALACVVAATPVGAAPGDLDSSVGDCGVRKASLDGFGGSPLSWAPQLPVLQQRDGKVLQLATVTNGIAIARLRSNGALDPTYGSGGIVRTTISRTATFQAAALAPDGKLLVAAAANFKLRVFRYLPTGALDPTFGNSGIAILDAERAGAMVVQSDRKPLILIGANGTGPPFFGVTRLLENGDVDRGYTFADDPASPTHVPLETLALGSDDRLLIAGTGAQQLGTSYRIGRWNTDGGRDPSYFVDATGSSNNPAGFPRAMLALPGGGVLVGGEVHLKAPARTDIFLTEYRADGTPDPGFGVGGKVVHSIGLGDQPVALRRSGDGSIVVLAITGLPGSNGVSLARFNANGASDPSFGRSGHVTVDLDSPLPPNGFALFGNTILVLTTRRLAVPDGTFPNATTVIARFRTDPSGPEVGLVLDGSGRLWPVGSGGSPAPCVFDGPRWASDFARGVATYPGQGGYVLDPFGGLHPFSLGVRPAPAATHGGPSWPGFDLARGVGTRSNGKGGYVLDAFGGLHSFATGTNSKPPGTRGGPSWPGWDIARGVALLPNGTGGFVLDSYGGLHPFAVGTNPIPPAAHGNPYTPGQDSSRGIAVLADGTGGYVVDAAGNLHGFGIGSHAAPPSVRGARLTGHPPAHGLVLVPPADAPAASTTNPASALPEPLVTWQSS